MKNDMLEIQLENGTRIPLFGKSLLMLPADSQASNITNEEDDYDVILILGGIDRIVDIKLEKPAIVIVQGGSKTTVNVRGGMALPISQAVFIDGVDNVVNGLTSQNKGKFVSGHGGEVDLGMIAEFDGIDIER